MITCLCMTHGRNWVLREAVECFLQQDYVGEKELLILNDCPEQMVDCPAPGVRVLNVEPIKDICEKQNYGVQMACFPWVALWDDDDISLPWRLRVMSDARAKMPEMMAFAIQRAWFSDDNRIVNASANLYAGAAFFDVDYYIACGGAIKDGAPDRSAWEAMLARGRAAEIDHTDEQIPYIYRWNGVGFHWSQSKFRKNVTKYEAFHSAVVSDPRFKPGHVVIKPGWDRDYVQDVKDAIQKGVPVL